MKEKNIESLGTKSIHVVVRYYYVFNARIILIESYHEVWSRLMEMHIVEKSYIQGKTKSPTKSRGGYSYP